jgi:putative ABC transport system permease protein
LNLSVSQPRFDSLLLGMFAGIATLLAAVGIYGPIACSVAQRTHEIGDPAKRVARGIRIAVGLAGAFALMRLLNAMPFGVGVTDALMRLPGPRWC